MTSYRSRFAIVLVLLLPLAACVSVKQPPPEKRFYGLNVTRINDPNPPEKGSILWVRKFQISPMYEDKAFVYRNGELSYQSDFYNEFLINPGPMITTQVTGWLTGANIFRMVVDSPGKILSDYILEGVITELYGDFQNPVAPTAVLEMQFFLLDDTDVHSRIIVQKQMRRVIPLKGGEPSDLIQGWNIALEQILTEFEQALRDPNLNFTKPGRTDAPASSAKDNPVGKKTD
jgi:cholesterol transport system auxiliary component